MPDKTFYCTQCGKHKPIEERRMTPSGRCKCARCVGNFEKAKTRREARPKR